MSLIALLLVEVIDELEFDAGASPVCPLERMLRPSKASVKKGLTSADCIRILPVAGNGSEPLNCGLGFAPRQLSCPLEPSAEAV